jgi:hypothetical protein
VGFTYHKEFQMIKLIDLIAFQEPRGTEYDVFYRLWHPLVASKGWNA